MQKVHMWTHSKAWLAMLFLRHFRITVIIAWDKICLVTNKPLTWLTSVHQTTLIATYQTQEVSCNAPVSLNLVMLLTVKTCPQLCQALEVVSSIACFVFTEAQLISDSECISGSLLLLHLKNSTSFNVAVFSVLILEREKFSFTGR